MLLALIFWIPGIYLEWPSDPWEHLRRINEWHALDTVTAHSSWKKSSYFLPYSLTGHTTGLTQLSWLNLYYTAVCLLLCWQYYLLGQAAGLGKRASFIFVLLTTLFLGNNVFSLFRYYGLSSSIVAQLGAIALTRIALEVFSRLGSVYSLPATRRSASLGTLSLSKGYSLLRSGGAGLALLPLIAFNHPQGLGIAGLGVLAVVVWRLIEWKRATIFWLAGAAALVSIATVLWFPRHPALDEIYRAEGWLTSWYGFNFFSSASPTFERSLHILGFFGVLNAALGLWLIIRRNHIAGWLTLMPVIALAMPCFALPFAHVLASKTSPDNIVTFHRFLFAVPMGLALVVLISCWTQSATKNEERKVANRKPEANTYSLLTARYSLLCAGLAGAVLLSPGPAAYNRLWHSLQVTSDDLNLRHFIAAWTPDSQTLAARGTTLIINHPLGDKVEETFTPSLDWRRWRQLHVPLGTAEIEQRINRFSALTPNDWSAATAVSQHATRFVRSIPASQISREVADLTAHDTPWLRLGGQPAEQRFTEGHLILSNPIGAASQIFSPNLIPLAQDQRYHLAATLRQTGDPYATNYLAVAWYDKNGKLLISSDPVPAGAGSPVGWANGTFSYYGLVNHPAPKTWTRYVIAFGSAENAAIPVNAAFIRVGVLLNYNETPGAKIQLKDAVLWQKQGYANLLLALPSTHNLYSPSSIAAQLSDHWGSQEVAKDHAGTSELRSVVLTGLK